MSRLSQTQWCFAASGQIVLRLPPAPAEWVPCLLGSEGRRSLLCRAAATAPALFLETLQRHLAAQSAYGRVHSAAVCWCYFLAATSLLLLPCYYCLAAAAAQVIVFCVTARLTQFYAEFMEAMGCPVLEIHSRKSQPARTRASDAFRAGSRVR